MSKKTKAFFKKNHKIVDQNLNIEYEMISLIGSGAFAQVYTVKSTKNEIFALKVVNHKEISSQSLIRKLETEIEIHSSTDHPNIVKLNSHFKDNEYLYLVLEYCSNKGLDEYLKKNKGIIEEEEVRKWMFQLINALIYLHEQMRIIHRDLKLGNLFLDKDLNLKIGDFGLSAEIVGNQKKRTVCGTPNYIAPEILFDKETGHSFEVDIWSYGVILFTLLVGTPPFQKNSVKEIYETIKNMDYNFPPDYKYSRYSKELIRRILNRDPDARPTLHDIKNDNFFTRKVNTVERMIKNIQNHNYVLAKTNQDHIIYSMPLTRFKGVGYVLASGLIGIYYYNHKNIVLKDKNTIMYLYKADYTNKPLIAKEEHNILELPDALKQEYDHLMYFCKNFCKDRIPEKVELTHVLRIKRVKNGFVFGLYNGIIQFDFNDSKKVVLAEEGKKIYSFIDSKRITFDDELKDKCLEILKLVK